MQKKSAAFLNVEKVLDSIARDFDYDPTIKSRLLGRTLAEIESSKKFPVLGRCAEEAMVVAHRLREAGFTPDIILKYRYSKIFVKGFHFAVGITLDGIPMEIPLRRGDLRLIPLPKEMGREVRMKFKFKLSPTESLEKLVTWKHRPFVSLKKAYDKLNPR